MSRFLFLLALCTGCSQATTQVQAPDTDIDTPAPQCAKVLPAPHLLPNVNPEHKQPGFWISRGPDPDKVILSADEIRELNRRAENLAKAPGLGSRFDIVGGTVDMELIVRRMSEGLTKHRQRATEGSRVGPDASAPAEPFFDAVDAIQTTFEPATDLHVAFEMTPVRCHPSAEPLYEYAGDVDFDLFLCFNLHPGELYREVSRHPEGWTLIRSGYAFGWVRQPQLGPVVSQEQGQRMLGDPQFVVVTQDRVPVWNTENRTDQRLAVDMGLRLPLLAQEVDGLVQVLAPSSTGLAPGWIDARHLSFGYLPMTRRNVIDHAFSRHDDAFGWAGAGGDRDCSRYLMDLFALFGLHLPRNSYWQSQAGSFAVATEGMDAAARRAALDQAVGQGVAFLFMPGHIMMLLGRDGDRYYSIHQFSGYRIGCAPGRDIKMAVDRVAVTTLELGEGSSRRSFFDRFTSIVVLGHR